ncbi:MAG: hypothetical protein WCT29_00675 [Candidatus Paceibacterota bacterium]|jgi:hypothetical protein
MNISEIMKSAPRYLAMRYGSLYTYVWQSLFPKEYINKVLYRIDNPKEKKEKFFRMKTIAEEASVLVFLFYTKKMLIEGANATKNTVDILKELDIKEFRLGKTRFAGRNNNVILGDRLAERLLRLLDDDVKRLLSRTEYMSQIIDHYRRLRNEERTYNYLFDKKEAEVKLKRFFANEKPRLRTFGNVVNQVFEAYTFASTIKWYQSNEWLVHIINPKVKSKGIFRLKFSTMGAPNKYSYAICEKGEKKCQIRHQLRVTTESYRDKNNYRANICCDISVINNLDLNLYSTAMAIPNKELISFGEVKHMSAFAELLANFVGLVHELQPRRLRTIRTRRWARNEHISPFLNVSGFLQPTAKGLNETIEKRKYDIDVYHYENKMVNI